MDIRVSALLRSLLWFVLLHSNSRVNKVSCCLDALLKEFSQMFAGPGGTLMGNSNANNLDRIRIFNNHQSPSIDQIEDEEALEGRMGTEDVDNYDDSGEEYVGARKSGCDEGCCRKFSAIPSRPEVNIERDVRPNKRSKKIDRTKVATSPFKKSGKETKEPSKRDSSKSKVIGLTKSRDKTAREKSSRDSLNAAERSETYRTPPKDRPLHSRRSSQSLYQLEPKTKSYSASAYKSNIYEDSDEDSMSFQTQDDTRNQVKTKKLNQPLIEMLSNVLDTIQLTSKWDYKRAKERELRDEARRELHRRYPDSRVL